MASRRKARRHALQILFQLDLTPQPVEQAIRGFYESLCSESESAAPQPDPFVEALVRGVHARRQEIDRLIARHAHNWRLERMPAVDRNAMRMAVFEMTALGSPPAVAINEALELARRFSGDQAVGFINGVLDAIRQELEAAGALAPSRRAARSRSRRTA